MMGGMGRLLLLALAIVLLVWMIRRALRARDHGAPTGGAPDELVRCAVCGVHTPKTAARAVGDRYYCSDAHARHGSGGG